MKKVFALLLLWMLFGTHGFAQTYDGASFRAQSYYGFSGMMFIPTAQTLQPHQISLSYLSKPVAGEDLTLEPFSAALAFGPKIKQVEVALTNTPFYASTREYGGVFIGHGVPELNTPAPIFPSVKYQIMPMTRENYRVAMAVGFALPYGAYYVVDKFFDVNLFDMTLHTGVGSKLTTYHAFAGATFTFGKRKGEINRDFPLELLVEGSWGGSLKQLNLKEEAFLSMSFRLAWTSSLFMTTFLRIDNQVLVQNDFAAESTTPTKRVGLGLNYVFR